MRSRTYEFLKKIRPLRYFVIILKQYYSGYKLRKSGISIILDLNYSIENYPDLKFTPAYGALLGLYRDGNFIKHDSDLDLFLLWPKKKFEYVNFLELKSIIGNYFGIRSKNFEYLSNHNKIKVVIDNIAVDIHIAVIEDDSQFVTLKHNLRVPNLTKFLVLGNEIMIPSNTENLLVELYGNNWRIPDKSPYSSRGKWPFSD